MANNKALAFSTFRHTLAYIARHMADTGLRYGLVHGGVADEERAELRRRFALPKEDPDALDVLLSSEVGSEGLDFQFCDLLINYDLPWNPMRVEQRIGRIDRYGQASETVAIVNLVTPGTVDADIYERCLLRIGVFRHAVGGSEEILGEITREIPRYRGQIHADARPASRTIATDWRQQDSAGTGRVGPGGKAGRVVRADGSESILARGDRKRREFLAVAGVVASLCFKLSVEARGNRERVLARRKTVENAAAESKGPEPGCLMTSSASPVRSIRSPGNGRSGSRAPIRCCRSRSTRKPPWPIPMPFT